MLTAPARSRPVSRRWLAGLLVAFTVAPAWAQSITQVGAQYLQVDRTLAVLGPDLFGESVDLYTGALSFSHTDVSLPGNDALPVRIVRTLAIDAGQNEWAFGSWDLDVPHLHGIYAKKDGWIADDANPGKRCSAASLMPPSASALQDVDVFDADEFWSGLSLDVDGGSARVLLRDPANTHVPAGVVAPLVTRDAWAIACLPSIKNGVGEGFLAHAPDGLRYRFDWLTTRSALPLSKPIFSNVSGDPDASPSIDPPGEIADATLQRIEARMLVTRVEDRFGNFVTYTYDPAKPDHLLSILASDGRSLTLTYVPNSDRIASVSDGTRTWTYTYAGNALVKVTLPDASAWSFNTAPLLQARVAYENGTGGCSMGTLPSNAAATWTGTLTHPSGAVGSFTVGVQRHALSDVFQSCRPVAGSDYANVPNLFDTIALRSKSITGPGVPAQTWTTSFSAPQPNWAPCNGCVTTKTVDVVNPANARTRYTFNTRKPQHGQLLQTDSGVAGNSALRREVLTYTPATGQAWPASLGNTEVTRGDPQQAEQLTPVTRRVITQDGVTFTWQATQFDDYARALAVIRSSSLGDSRSETTAYYDHTALWVLGQPRQTTVDGVVNEVSTFDALARLKTVSLFGQLQKTLAYNADGTLASITDANNHTTGLASWYRGIPRTVTHPDGSTQAAQVNTFGWITQVTDETGASTSYTHDAMGRIASIAYPANNPAWNQTTQVFERAGTPEAGLAAGHWRQTIATGTARTVTHVDAYWRPRVIEEVDTAHPETHRVRRIEYDVDGRQSFASYPGASSAPTTGVWTTYDALGRIASVSQDSEDGLLTTGTQYLAGFKTKVTNPRGASTTTTYQAFDTPSYDAPEVSEEPLGITTTVTRDVYGKPTSLTRSGPFGNGTRSATRRFVYDAQQRLCKNIEDESGSAVFDYDAAGNILWQATGQPLPANTCDRASVPASQRATLTRDARDRVTAVDQPADAADLSYTYFPDGALKTATAAASTNHPTSTWTYAYDTRRLLTSETLAFDGRTSTIVHGRDANAATASLTYPSGQSIAFNPNALGQPQQAGAYATNVAHHPNGAPATWTYGNGLQHSLTLNTRQRPDRLRDTRNGVSVLDHSFDYDANANLVGRIDGTPGALETADLAYDARDRLLSNTVDNKYGIESFEYDPLDNITRAVIAGLDLHYHHNARNQLDRITLPGDDLLRSYTWNPRGALATRSQPGVPNPAGLFRDGFEQGGDVLPPVTETLVFDSADRLRGITGVATYTYDAHGHRLRTQRTDGTERTQIYTRAGQLLEEQDTQSNQRIDYITLNGTLIAKRTRPLNGNTATVTTLHSDARGTPTVETDAAGQVILRTRLTPFGSPYDGVYRNGPGFTGHVTDADSQLNDMQQRYYDAVMFGFLSTDPVASSAASFGRYTYANNNPYRFVDPDGRWVCSSENRTNCVQFREGLNRLSKAAKNSRLNKRERATLQRTIDFYGEEGDDTVSIMFNSNLQADGSISYGPDDKSIATFNMRRIGIYGKDAGKFFSGVIAHEGQHGVDDRARGRPIASRSERRDTERHAYWAQAHAQNSLNFSLRWGDIWTSSGGYSESAIELRAETSINISCGANDTGSCQ